MEKLDVVVKIRQIANELLSIADSLDEPKQSISLVDVRKLLAELSRDGKTADVRELLNKHGADKLSAVDPTKYEALLADARNLQ